MFYYLVEILKDLIMHIYDYGYDIEEIVYDTTDEIIYDDPWS